MSRIWGGRLALLVAISVLAACSSGGSGGGGDGGSDDSGGVVVEPEPDVTGPVEARIAWAAASGPVDYYRVYVTRSATGSSIETTVEQPQVVLRGEPGERVRVQVQAVSATGQVGPLSPPSQVVVFTDDRATNLQALEQSESVATSTSAARAPVAEPTAAAAPAERATIVLPSDKTVGDFDGDGAADLLWEASEPYVELRIENLWNDTIVRFERPEGSWWIAGTGDVDGDGLTDLVWQSAQGVVAYTPLESLLVTAPEAPLLLLGTLDVEETVVAIGDFAGDGTADLLIAAGGGHTLLLRDESGATERLDLATSARPGSQLLSTADYDGDGRSDLLWRTPEGGLEVGFMNGAREESRTLVVDTVSTPLLADGDFDADGAADLAVRNAAGGLGVLLLGDREPATAWDRSVDAGAGWQPSGARDYDGDGSADLVWTSETARLVRTHPVDGGPPVDHAIERDGDWTLVGELP